MKNKNKGFISLMALVLVVGALVAGSVYEYVSHKQTPQPVTQTFGDFNPTGGQIYRLQSTISSTQPTITLTSFKEPVSNIKYTMAYLNSSIEYATIDPNGSTKEFISFTGITQNNDNTATLTGVSRGLGFSYPYTASTTLAQPHSGQSIFILSNPPQLTNQYAARANAQNISGIWNFDTPPILNSAATSTNQAASIAYVNGIAFGGAVVTVAGGGTGNTSLPLNMFLVGNGTSAITSTSSPTVGYITATSTTITSTFAGPLRLNGINLITASTSLVATTSIAASNVNSNALILNNLPYSFPSSRGASGTFLTENGSGVLTFSAPTVPQYSAYDPAFNIQCGSSCTASTTIISIPAGVMNASSTITVSFSVVMNQDGANAAACNYKIRNSLGQDFITSGVITGSTVADSYGPVTVKIFPNVSVSAQRSFMYGYVGGQGSNIAATFESLTTTASSAFNLANAFSIVANVRTTSGGTTNCAMNNVAVTVNP